MEKYIPYIPKDIRIYVYKLSKQNGEKIINWANTLKRKDDRRVHFFLEKGLPNVIDIKAVTEKQYDQILINIGGAYTILGSTK